MFEITIKCESKDLAALVNEIEKEQPESINKVSFLPSDINPAEFRKELRKKLAQLQQSDQEKG